MSPSRPKRPCAQPGCAELVSKGKCDRHRKQYERQRTARRRTNPNNTDSFYWSAYWRKIRAAKLRADPLCAGCLAVGRTTAATEVDHQDGNQRNNDPENLTSYCKPCHSRKTVREDGGFGR